MPIVALPLPLSCTVNTASVLITNYGEYVFEMNNRLRVQIDLFPLSQHGTTIQSDACFMGDPSSEQVSVKTAEMHDIADKDMMTCEKYNTNI